MNSKNLKLFCVLNILFVFGPVLLHMKSNKGTLVENGPVWVKTQKDALDSQSNLCDQSDVKSSNDFVIDDIDTSRTASSFAAFSGTKTNAEQTEATGRNVMNPMVPLVDEGDPTQPPPPKKQRIK